MQRLSHRPLAALVALVPAALAAQTATGRVTGVITDENHMPVQGAQVSLSGTTLGGLTGLDGRYTIGGVPAGSYELRVQRIGQRPRAVPGVVVRAGEATTTDASLEAAAATL